MTAADRQRAKRRRSQRGLVPHRIDIDDAVFESLYHARLLQRSEASDPRKVRAALSKMAQDWARRVNPFL